MVKEALASGDKEAAKVLYDELPQGGYKPSFEELQSAIQRTEERIVAQATNEGVQTIKDRYGSNAGVVQKMKNFLRISADKADPITGLEFQEHIPERIFGVSSDSVATSLGMTEDEFLQQLLSELNITKKLVPTAVKEVEVPRSQLPVGTGEEKALKLEARSKGVIGKATPEQIEQLGLSTSNTAENDRQLALAAKFVNENSQNNYKKVFDVLLGDTPTPSGLLTNAIYVAMTQVEGLNLNLATKLAALSSKRFGQEIQVLSTIDPNSVASIVRDIYTIKEEIFKKRYGNKTPEKVIESTIKKGIEKIKPPNMLDWAGLINVVRC